MGRPDALSGALRSVTRLSAVLYAATGLIFFLVPGWSAERFPWRVTPFVAMTIGGWCLGNAAMAGLAVRRWRWADVRSVLQYLWWFAALQVAVLVWFLPALRLEAPLTWLYVASLGVGLATAAWGVVDLVRIRPDRDARGAVTTLVRVVWMGFVLFVGFLAAVAVFRPEVGATGRIFPQELSPFTVRAFGAFYLSLTLGALPLLWARTVAPTLGYVAGGLWPIGFISAAAVVHWRTFDAGARPTQLVYPGVYAFAAAVALFVLWWTRRAR